MPSAITVKLLDDIKAAMKAQNKEELLALRTLNSEIKNMAIDQRRELDDGDVMTVLSRAIKQRRDSIEQYTAAGRTDLAAVEQQQIDLYRRYLPQPLSRDEIVTLVKKAIQETGAVDKKQTGLVMKAVIPATKGRAEGKEVSAIVAELLS